MFHLPENADPASWIQSRLHQFGLDVGSFIPEGFAAYARVFHPPYRVASGEKYTPARWRDIAEANGRTIADEMHQLDRDAYPSNTSASGEVLWDEQPAIGGLPREVAARLAAVLRVHTRTPESCWFAVWEGFADLPMRVRSAPMFSVPARNLFLLRGTVDDVSSSLSDVDWSHRSPNICWPEDRAWCVVSEIDFTWSYVGGSAECIEQILGDPELEAIPTRPVEGNFMQTEERLQEILARDSRALASILESRRRHMERVSQGISLVTSSFVCLFFATRLVGQGVSIIPLVGLFFGALGLGATGALWLARRQRAGLIVEVDPGPRG
jgi:hypothetical protein